MCITNPDQKNHGGAATSFTPLLSRETKRFFCTGLSVIILYLSQAKEIFIVLFCDFFWESPIASALRQHQEHFSKNICKRKNIQQWPKGASAVSHWVQGWSQWAPPTCEIGALNTEMWGVFHRMPAEAAPPVDNWGMLGGPPVLIYDWLSWKFWTLVEE